MSVNEFSTEALVTGAIQSDRSFADCIADLATLKQSDNVTSDTEIRAVEKAMNLLEVRIYLTRRYLQFNEWQSDSQE